MATQSYVEYDPAVETAAQAQARGRLVLTSPQDPQEHALEVMRRPFAAHQISKMCRPTKKDNQPGTCRACGGFHKLPSVQLSYVGHAALTDRLLEADPKWTWEPMARAPDGTPLIDKDGGMWIKLTVAGVTRFGYGDAQGKIGGDAMKERIGDALRNAAMRFGAALELWHKGDLHIVEPSQDAGPKYELNLQEHLEWIANAKDVHELQRLYLDAYKAARNLGDREAMATLVAAKDAKKKELQ